VAEVPSVCLAIATFRSDEAVIALVESVLEADSHGLFSEILVVDSMGTGRVPEVAAARGWDRVRYFDHEVNLGSAGNLARRLELGAERGHRWTYTVNHDGEVDLGVVRRLVEVGESLDRVGAIYPLRYKTGRGRYDLTGTQRLPLPFRGARRRPEGPLIETYWGSSNATLYASAPVHEGLLPWADLWMGWEDLGYGWLLERHGYQQVIVTDAENRDPYEYRRRGPVVLTDKPSWYAYYQVRNLILVTRRNAQPLSHWLTVAGRVAVELGLTAALRPDKPIRYRLLARGLLDGLRGRAGKWRLP
jgi:hypothetical protein